MSDTARDYQSIEPVSTKGLEEIFEVRELDASQDANLVRLDASVMSVEEAADRLKISVRAVQKRLKKGALIGRKEKTAHGERWLVKVRELDASQDANLVRLDASRDELDANPLSVEQIAVSNTHLELIRELQHKNESLIFRTGYLESELNNYKQQVKLLTDSQHKPDKWQRFRSWFFGQ